MLLRINNNDIDDGDGDGDGDDGDDDGGDEHAGITATVMPGQDISHEIKWKSELATVPGTQHVDMSQDDQGKMEVNETEKAQIRQREFLSADEA